MSSNFHFLVPEASIQSLVQIDTVVSEKIQFFLYVHDLGRRSRNDLDLQYLHFFIYSIRCHAVFILLMIILHMQSLKAVSMQDYLPGNALKQTNVQTLAIYGTWPSL